MMVQGHTIDAVLAPQYRDFSSITFTIWDFMRGLTAPIFLFSAGTVFVYLFDMHEQPFLSNLRVKKALKRVLVLLFFGYMLKYPSYTIIHLYNVKYETWKAFFAVDVLQLIAAGLLILLLCLFIAEKLKVRDLIVFVIGALCFFGLFPLVNNINWIDYFPLPLADYFYSGKGSNFPIFPWAGYVLAGGVMGSYLAGIKQIDNPVKFCAMTGIAGTLMVLGYYWITSPLVWTFGSDYLKNINPTLPLQRIGCVLIICCVLSIIAFSITHIPHLIKLIGKYTLTIYVVHLLIVYGSAWNNGLYQKVGQTLNPMQSIGIALIIIVAMILMVMVREYLGKVSLTRKSLAERQNEN